MKKKQGHMSYVAPMLILLNILTASGDTPAQPAAIHDAQISVSVTPIVHHPQLEVELQSKSADFRKVLSDNQGQLVYCFERSLKNTPDLTGKLTMVTSIHEGVVQSVSATTDTFSNEKIGSCVAAQMRSWRFPADLSDEFVLPFTCGSEVKAP
jgi:hypothetical protein